MMGRVSPFANTSDDTFFQSHVISDAAVVCFDADELAVLGLDDSEDDSDMDTICCDNMDLCRLAEKAGPLLLLLGPIANDSELLTTQAAMIKKSAHWNRPKLCWDAIIVYS